jgi:hypothetical protein
MVDVEKAQTVRGYPFLDNKNYQDFALLLLVETHAAHKEKYGNIFGKWNNVLHDCRLYQIESGEFPLQKVAGVATIRRRFKNIMKLPEEDPWSKNPPREVGVDDIAYDDHRQGTQSIASQIYHMICRSRSWKRRKLCRRIMLRGEGLTY